MHLAVATGLATVPKNESNVCLIYAVRSRLTELGADKNEDYEKMHSTLKKNFKRNYIMPTDST